MTTNVSFLSQLDWRFATKVFTPHQTVRTEDLDEILRAIRSAPTSFGLQPFHVYVVTDSDVRAKLKPVSFDQAQVTDASHVLIFCYRTDARERIPQYVAKATTQMPEHAEALKGYGAYMQGFAERLTDDWIHEWAKRQTYIALGFGLAACAELQIDSCPMEGFNTEEVDRILNLPSHVKSIVYMTVGYRAEEPTRPKFRFSDKDLFTTV
ncbi:NAD(P)H-dependent oxidoreductase [Candidatus Uhrbacteria bacterium]|nr:NAD(P)H-dependent oxidoreductase [Candidatus Uhrbacteria bacterium]MBD3283849.1 NAD(P)H-dependent oxidoreductase [Candidatus Uhrbacteria bacterium]